MAASKIMLRLVPEPFTFFEGMDAMQLFSRWVGGSIVCTSLLLPGMVLAEVVRDGTIGLDRANQPIGPNFLLPETLGELHGSNLLHSFDEFSLAQGQSATFSATSSVDNIIARITGPEASILDGPLRATVSANLYLMNPHGVIFGPNAQLDLHGAFYASTAESLTFSNGEVFEAAPDGSVPLLATATPAQFGFLSPSAGAIELHGSRLTSAHDVTLRAGAIVLRDGATILTEAEDSSAGAITLTASERIIFSGTDEHMVGASLRTASRGVGEAGAIRLDAPIVELRDGALLSTDAAGAGNGGTVVVSATERVTLAGHVGNGVGSRIQAHSHASGNAGLIQLDAPVIELQDGAEITNIAHDAGNGGELLLSATERITLSGKNGDGLGANLQAGTAATATGKGGTLRVDAPFIDLRDGARMVTSSKGDGRSGDLFITARDRVTLSGTDNDGFGSRLQANTDGVGDAGAILITAAVIALHDGAAIQTNTGGASTGSGGTLSVRASEHVIFSGTDKHGDGSSLQAIANGNGLGGSVLVEAPVIELQDGAFLTANATRSAVSGAPPITLPNTPDAHPALIVRADQRLTLSGINGYGQGSSIETTAWEQSQARAISIIAPVTALHDGAVISSASGGTGAAGAIRIRAEESLTLTGSSQITTLSYTTSGGDITLESGHLMHLRDSSISTNVGSGAGEGGDITIAANSVLLDDSDITAYADGGRGGQIDIAANVLVRSTASLISAAAGPEGVDGEIVTRIPTTDLTRELAGSQAASLDVSTLLRPRCEARGVAAATGSFHVARQQGLPLSPEDLLMAFDSAAVTPRPSVSETATAADDPTTRAVTAFRTGQFEQAGEHWTQASARAQADGDAQAQGQALRGLAESQQVRGDFSASLTTLQRALAQAVVVQDAVGIAASQGQIGNAYLALGEADQAERWMQEAIERATAANDAALLAILFNNLGNHHMVQQRYAEALRAYQASAQHAPATDQRAKALSNAIRAGLAVGQGDEAVALLDQARAVVQTLPSGHAKIDVLIHLAKSAERIAAMVPSAKRQSLVAAYSDLREAAMLSREANDLRNLSYALGNLGHLYQAEQRHSEALYLTHLAQQAAEQVQAPDALYRWHWQTGQLLWAQGEWEAALQAYRRAVVILEDSRQETRAQYGSAPVRFRRAVAPVYNEFVDALLQRAGHLGDAAAGAPLLLEARATIEQFKAAELRDYFRDECVTDLEAKTTRLEAVAPNAAVIYPIILPQRLELLVSLPSGLKRYTVPVEAATLTTAIQRFRDTVETHASEVRVRDAGHTVYAWLVQPFAADLAGIDTLVFVPGGVLRTVPLAALFDGEAYLIQRYQIAVTPGLSLTDPRPLNRHSAKFVLAGLSHAVQEFPALPAVRQELQDVQNIFGGRLLLNQDYTAARLQQLLEQPVSVVHIASHAQFTGVAESSFLLTYDGRLTMDDLGRYLSVTRFRDPPLELLVLSACQTAAGDERAALGLAGVGIKAGARSAVGSLWSIDDAATAEIMVEFYRQLKDPDVSKARALQAAQQYLVNNRRFSHPYYWSPYLLINNWL